MYENILLPLIILCAVTLMYCKKEIMKYKNPSIVQQQMKEKIWGEMIMTVSEEDKNYYSYLLENIRSECHDCKHLYLDYEYYKNLNDEFPFFDCFKGQLVHIDEYNPRPPCKYKEEATRK